MGADKNAEIYQFKVTLIGITTPIWRRIFVPGDCTLAQFHRVLQVVMGWENYHLYMFRIGGKTYGPPDPDGDGELGLDRRETDTSSLGIAERGDHLAPIRTTLATTGSMTATGGNRHARSRRNVSALHRRGTKLPTGRRRRNRRLQRIPARDG